MRAAGSNQADGATDVPNGATHVPNGATDGPNGARDAADEAPDWGTLRFDLHCPRCGYDLRLLPHPRCPECGLEFRWRDLMDAEQTRRTSPLFEYHWRDRPVRSLVGTIARATLPWRLWQETRVVHEPRLKPLLVLLLIATILHAALWVGARYATSGFQSWLFTGSGGLAALTWQSLALPAYLSTLAVDFALPLLTLAALRVGHQSLTKYRIRNPHLIRIVVLGAVGLLAWNAFTRALVEGVWIVFFWRAWSGFNTWHLVRAIEWCADLLPLIVFALAVASGLSRALQLPRGWLMGLLGVLVALLIVVLPVAVAIDTLGIPYWGSRDSFYDGFAGLPRLLLPY